MRPRTVLRLDQRQAGLASVVAARSFRQRGVHSDLLPIVGRRRGAAAALLPIDAEASPQDVRKTSQGQRVRQETTGTAAAPLEGGAQRQRRIDAGGGSATALATRSRGMVDMMAPFRRRGRKPAVLPPRAGPPRRPSSRPGSPRPAGTSSIRHTNVGGQLHATLTCSNWPHTGLHACPFVRMLASGPAGTAPAAANGLLTRGNVRRAPRARVDREHGRRMRPLDWREAPDRTMCRNVARPRTGHAFRTQGELP